MMQKMDEKARIAELEKALKKMEKANKSLEGKLDKQKKATREAKKELKKKDAKSYHFSEKEKEVISLVFPDIDPSKLP